MDAGNRRYQGGIFFTVSKTTPGPWECAVPRADRWAKWDLCEDPASPNSVEPVESNDEANHKWYHAVSRDTMAFMAMTLRLSDEQTARLRETADREGLSMQAAAQKAIAEYTSRRTVRRDAMLAQILTEDAGVLKRLADA
jgi:predicted transcriptional regulator